MKIGFVGAGKVGFALGKYAKGQGINLSGYVSRSSGSAKEAAGFVGTAHFASLSEVLAASDLLFLSVPDGEIAPVWRELKTLPLAGKRICHLSGSLSSAVFDEIERTGADGFSLHPFFAVSSKFDSHKELHRAFFTLEGSGASLSEIKALIEGMGNPVYIIEPGQKILYHTAAVFLSNHVAALAQIGCKLLEDCGFEEAAQLAALQTLFLGHCQKIAAAGPIKSLTGPVERGDAQTVKGHLGCLPGPEKQLYARLSETLTQMARDKHPGRDYTAIEALIGQTMEEYK